MFQVDKNTITQKVKAIVSDKAGVQIREIADTDDIYDDHGMDSLDGIETYMEIEREFGIVVPDGIQENTKTVGGIVEYLDSILNPVGV